MNFNQPSPNNNPPPENLTGKEVGDFGKEVGRDIAKQSIVWTFASYLTQFFRWVITRIFSRGKPSS
jgi:hypothetical protein